MCIIAGYSGNRPAAPILVEMMKKQEYVDGGLSTGLATIHEGKLYYRKVVGDVETLLRETDVLELPGTTGIMHSRTGGNGVQYAHPFISNDGNIALITNGTTGEVKCPEFFEKADSIMRHFLERGFEINTASEPKPEDTVGRSLPGGKNYMLTEPYLFMIEEWLENIEEGADLRAAIADATRNAINTLPRNFVTVNIDARIADTVTIGNCARPVMVGFGDGETFFASCGFALPEYVTKRPVISLPPTSVSQISPDGLKICSTSLENARVEQIDYRIAADMMKYLEEHLVGAEDNPISVYDACFGNDWSNTWSKPYNEGKFKSGKGYFKPYAALFYEALFAYYKQGRLHIVDGERKGVRITKFWADPV